MASYAVWVNSTYYNTADIVEYLGNLYRALSPNVNKQPTLFPAIWALDGGTAVLGITAGAGITVNPVPATNPTVSTNLSSADGRLTITPGFGTNLVLTNTCPASIGAGAGINITGTPATGITVNNTGIQTLAVGAGLSSTGGVTPTIANTGVIGVTAGAGITINPLGGGVFQLIASATSAEQCKNFVPPNVVLTTAPSTVFNIASISLAGFAATNSVYSVACRITGSMALFASVGLINFYLSNSPIGLPNSNQSPIINAIQWQNTYNGLFDTGGFIVQFRVIPPPPLATLYLNGYTLATPIGTNNFSTSNIRMNVVGFSAAVVP